MPPGSGAGDVLKSLEICDWIWTIYFRKDNSECKWTGAPIGTEKVKFTPNNGSCCRISVWPVWQRHPEVLFGVCCSFLGGVWFFRGFLFFCCCFVSFCV